MTICRIRFFSESIQRTRLIRDINITTGRLSTSSASQTDRDHDGHSVVQRPHGGPLRQPKCLEISQQCQRMEVWLQTLKVSSVPKHLIAISPWMYVSGLRVRTMSWGFANTVSCYDGSRVSIAQLR
jgi:hypothetical protein